MIVVLRRRGRSIDEATFADITPVEVTSVAFTDDGAVAVEFASDLSATDRILVRIRAASADAADETLLRQAYTAHANNTTYLAIPAPTNAQVVAQVAALTRQTNGIIRVIAPVD